MGTSNGAGRTGHDLVDSSCSEIRYTDTNAVRVYGLVDPRDSFVRYVGVTRLSVSERLATHLRESAWQDTAKAMWLRELAAIDVVPAVVILSEFATESMAYAAERSIIRSLKLAGVPLTNSMVMEPPGTPVHGAKVGRVTLGGRKLASYLQEQRISAGAFAKRAHVCRVTMHNVMVGARYKRITVDFALGCQRASGGAIDASDFAPESVEVAQ